MATINYPFPSELDHPSKKEEKSWGLKAAKAIHSNNQNYGNGLFFNNKEEHLKYLKYFRGEQDVNKYKPSVGINPRDAKDTWVNGIRWQNKNYATKRVNVAVSKIFNRQYDPIASSIDPLAIDRKEDYKAKVKTFMENQAWLAEVQQYTNVNVSPNGMSMEDVPIDDEDLKIHVDNNHKYNDEEDLELGIQYHLDRNKFEQIKKMYDFDFFIFGGGGAYAGMDSSLMPETKWLDPSKLIVPRSDLPDFSRSKYAGYIDDYTVAEFRKLHGGEIEEELEKMIIEKYSNKGESYDYSNEDAANFKDVDKITIMHFEIKSTNQLVALEKKDKAGNTRFHEKDYDYYKTPSEQSKFRERYKGERKLIRKPYDCVYSGYWIVGSDTIFSYGKKKNSTGRLGYKIHAPNLRDNQVLSTMKQMIPSLDLLETYDKKIQQIVASSVPKGVQIDLEALSNATFQVDGKDMNEMDMIELWLQKGILIMAPGEAYNVGSSRKPVEELENGMSNDVVHYINLMRQELENLDEIIGINKVTAASSLHQDTGKGVAEQMQMSTEVALDYLYQADKVLTNEIYEELADLHIQSVKYNDPKVYVPIFGETSVRRMKEAFSRHKYGIKVEARPTQLEWAQFYQDLKAYVKDGFIAPEDEMMIRRSNNLKQAQAYMRVVMKRRKKEAQEAKMQDIQANAQAQGQSNEAAHKKAMQLEQVKGQTELQKIAEERKTEALKHKWKMEEIVATGEIERKNKVLFIDKEGDEVLEKVALQGNVDLKKVALQGKNKEVKKE